MTREELIKILEDYEIFVDDDFGGSYKSIIAYTSDKKVSRAHTPIGTLKIIDTFEEIQNQNKKYKEVIDKAIEFINREIEIIKEQPSENKSIDEYILTKYNGLLNFLKEAE